MAIKTFNSVRFLSEPGIICFINMCFKMSCSRGRQFFSWCIASVSLFSKKKQRTLFQFDEFDESGVLLVLQDLPSLALSDHTSN